MKEGGVWCTICKKLLKKLDRREEKENSSSKEERPLRHQGSGTIVTPASEMQV
jgi:hypothetical protein